MIICKHIQRRLSAYMDDELLAEQRRQIENHLTECRNCSQLLANWERVYFQMAQTPESHTAPFFETRLKARLDQAPSPRFSAPQFILRRVLAPAAVCFGLLVGAFLGIQLNAHALAPLETQQPSLTSYLDTGFLEAIPQGSLTAAFIDLTATSE